MINTQSRPRIALRKLSSELTKSTSGIALIEFAYVLPILLAFASAGIEVANYANARMTMSQIALTLADNGSRIGAANLLSNKTIDETDINDILNGALNQSQNLKLRENGRVILSSLQVNSDSGQWIAWQRCAGARTDFVSHYGSAGDGETGTSFPGIGTPGNIITAVPGSAVMFVELQYKYQPVFKIMNNITGDTVISYTSAFTVRQDRNLNTVSNNSNVTLLSC